MSTVALRLQQAALLATAALLLGACHFRPDPVSAHSMRAGDEELVTVAIRSSDARTIKSRQLYFSVVVKNCQDGAEGYPAEAYIDGQRASEFAFDTTSEVIEVMGRVPAHVFDTYPNPCAFFLGGGYFTGKIMSAPVRIEKVPVSAPNYGFKRTAGTLHHVS